MPKVKIWYPKSDMTMHPAKSLGEAYVLLSDYNLLVDKLRMIASNDIPWHCFCESEDWCDCKGEDVARFAQDALIEAGIK